MWDNFATFTAGLTKLHILVGNFRITSKKFFAKGHQADTALKVMPLLTLSYPLNRRASKKIFEN